MKRTAKVGDRVFFKEDIEGSGVVAKVTRERGWNGSYETYLVKSEGEPNGYPFHPMATFNHELNCMVVYTDRIWALD